MLFVLLVTLCSDCQARFVISSGHSPANKQVASVTLSVTPMWWTGAEVRDTLSRFLY